jgi:hypothetical protein
MRNDEYIVEVLPNDECVHHGLLVRCRDCRYSLGVADHWFQCLRDNRMMKHDGYCSWGEFKDDQPDRQN